MSVRGSTIEFAENGGSTRRYDRSDVARIELTPGPAPRATATTARAGVPRGFASGRRRSTPRRSWTDTGIDVRSGMTVFFEASGKVQWGPDRKDGPAGEGGNHHNPGRPIPSRSGAALIGRVGNSEPFLIGDERGPIRMRESGRLSLGVNDDYLQDNRGSFRVTIYY